LPLKKQKTPPRATIKITAETVSFFKGAKKISEKQTDLLYKKNNHPTARLGIIISKKAVNFAVSRNKIRRAIREDFKKGIKELGSYDILIVITRKTETEKNKLANNLIREWKKLKKSLPK